MSPSATEQLTAPVPSSQRCEPGSINIAIAKWPKTAADGPLDALAVAEDVVSKFNSDLQKAPSKEAAEGVASLFTDESYWRDHLTLSWDLRTLKTKSKIAAYLQTNTNLTKLTVDTSTEFRAPKISAFNPKQSSKGIVLFVNVETKVGRGHGVVRLAEEQGSWKIWTLFTTLEELKGHEEPIGQRRPTGVSHGYHKGRKNWLDRRRDEENFTNSEPDVLVLGKSSTRLSSRIYYNAETNVILGAGQAGLTAHARLKMLNVSTLIVDANENVGDNWRKRYHQLVLHDPIWYDHLPYIPFPDWWPIFTPKDKLADFFQSYAKLLDLNVWMRTTIESASWDDSSKRWKVALRRTLADGTTETRTLHPKHLVQSTGHSGKANLPQIKGMDGFKGDLICHSSAFPGAMPNSQGKKAIVVGACNSSHDICQDYYENGYDVTMVQRSSTCVISSESVCKINLAGSYEEGGPATEDADLMAWGTPAEVLKATHFELTKLQQEKDKATLQGLAKAGFKVDKGPDDCGLYIKYFQRGGGKFPPSDFPGVNISNNQCRLLHRRRRLPTHHRRQNQSQAGPRSR